MTAILCIETATKVCSVSIGVNGESMVHLSIEENNRHSAEITNLIQKCLGELDLTIDQLDAVALSHGPGSYTGLRVGASVAKGICYSLNKPLIAIPTLESLARITIKSITNAGDSVIMPMIDARRMEVYTCLFKNNISLIKPLHNLILREEDLLGLLKEYHSIIVCGNGAYKCKASFSEIEGLIYLPGECRADHLCEPAHLKWDKKDFENLINYTPLYYKSPHITKSNKRIFK